ncbi:MAG: hypothetical protein R8P61_34655 [Bacteroidia bacterium]|nr:hypothetical protein [Bacteroidia bacterium]
MKYFTLLLSFSFLLMSSSIAQDKYAADVASLDAIIEALYGSISGDKGEKRDWDRFKYLFTPEAKLIPSAKNPEGITKYRIMTPESYVETSGSYLEENGFFEKETYRVTEEYGSLVHIFSTYDSYHTSKDEKPFARGINSIQLLHDGKRWWIMQIYWLGETKDNPLPAKYLPKE